MSKIYTMKTIQCILAIFFIHLNIYAQSPELRFVRFDGIDGECKKLLSKSFEDPALFLANPEVGFEDPAVFFKKKLKGFEDPAVFLPKGVSEFEDPAVFLEKYRKIEWVELKLKPLIKNSKSILQNSKFKPVTHKLEIGKAISSKDMSETSGYPAIIIKSKTEIRVLLPKFAIAETLLKSHVEMSLRIADRETYYEGQFSE